MTRKVNCNDVKEKTYTKIYYEFDVVCTVHRKQLYKQTNKMHFLYVFIIQFCTTLHVSNGHFVHHQEFMVYCICSCVQTVQTCLTAKQLKQLDTFARFVHSCRYSKP